MSWYCDIGCVVEIPPPRYASKDSKDAEKKFYRRAQAHPSRIPSGGTCINYEVICCTDCINAFDDVVREMDAWKRIVDIDNELNATHTSRVVGDDVTSLKMIHTERNVLLQKLADEAKCFFEKRKTEVAEANKDKSASDWL